MSEKRIHCSVTMNKELYAAIKTAAKSADQPLTVWCREALKTALQKANELGGNIQRTT